VLTIWALSLMPREDPGIAKQRFAS
jgi:hypothetical protein